MALQLVTEFNNYHFILHSLVFIFVLPHVFVIGGGGPFALNISDPDAGGVTQARRSWLPPQ